MSDFSGGFIYGIIIGILANFLFERLRSWIRGKNPYMSIKIEGDNIQFEGQIRKTETGQTVIDNLSRTVDDPDTTT